MDKQTEIAARLVEARRERGIAVANGYKPRNNAEIAALELELDALDDAEGESVRRDREAAEAERIKQAEILKVELAALQRSYLQDVQEAQEHARGLAAAIGRALEGSAAMVRVAHRLTEKPAPLPLGIRDVETRFGCRLAAVMSTVPDHAHRLGANEWQPGHFKSTDDWHEAEAALLDRHVAPLCNRKGNENVEN